MSLRLFGKSPLVFRVLLLVLVTLWGVGGLLQANQATSRQRSSVNGNLILTVITESRTPLAGVTALLTHASQPYQWSLKTDPKGRIIRVGRQGLPHGIYQVIVQKNHYWDYSFSVEIPENGAVTKVVILKAKE